MSADDADVYDVRYNYELEERRIQITHKDDPDTVHFLGDGTQHLSFKSGHGFAGEFYAIKARESYVEDEKRYFRAHLLVLDKANDIHMELVFDDYRANDIQDVYAIDDTLIVQLEVSKNENDLDTPKTVFYFYENKTLTFEHVMDESLSLSEQEGSWLFLKRKASGPYISAFDQDGKLYQASDFMLEDDNYQAPLELVLFDEARLNEETLSQGVKNISYPGYYTLDYQGKTTTFAIDPNIDDFETDKTYYTPLDIHYAYGQLYLNKEPYTSGTIIDEPGHHEFKVIGLNDYEKTYTFTIKNDLEAFEENLNTTPVTLDFMGEIWLNGALVETGHTIYQGGDYTIEITGHNEYKQSINVSLLTDEVTLKDQLLSLEIGIAISILILSGLGLFGLYKKR